MRSLDSILSDENNIERLDERPLTKEWCTFEWNVSRTQCTIYPHSFIDVITNLRVLDNDSFCGYALAKFGKPFWFREAYSSDGWLPLLLPSLWWKHDPVYFVLYFDNPQQPLSLPNMQVRGVFLKPHARRQYYKEPVQINWFMYAAQGTLQFFDCDRVPFLPSPTQDKL